MHVIMIYSKKRPKKNLLSMSNKLKCKMYVCKENTIINDKY